MVVQAVEECIRVEEEAGIAVQISHLKPSGATTGAELQAPTADGGGTEEGCRGDGRRISVHSRLFQRDHNHAAMGAGKVDWTGWWERLKDPETRSKIRSDIENTSDWENLIMKLGYENIVVTFCRKDEQQEV